MASALALLLRAITIHFHFTSEGSLPQSLLFALFPIHIVTLTHLYAKQQEN